MFEALYQLIKNKPAVGYGFAMPPLATAVLNVLTHVQVLIGIMGGILGLIIGMFTIMAQIEARRERKLARQSANSETLKSR